MKFGDKIDFNLTKKYDFRVTVKGKFGSFSAELKLSPEAITIRISGDESEDRRWGFPQETLDHLECFGIDGYFFLFDLHCIKSGSFAVGGQQRNVSHFEAEYLVRYIVTSATSLGTLDIRSIHLFSSTLEKWIGYTEKQQEIIENQVSGSRMGLNANFGNFDTTEFCVRSSDNIVAINYNFTTKASPLEFEVGVRFPPSFCVFSQTRILPKEAMPLYQKVYSFLSLLHGNELSMDRIELRDDYTGVAYLYYPKRALSQYEISAYSWFPLSNNLRFDSLGHQPFPLDSISKYFSKENSQSEKWNKYIKYRRMKNTEEKFLGCFRLLESLTKTSKSYLEPALLKIQVKRVERIMIRVFGNRKNVRAFLGGIDRYNNSKYNTEKCIFDFYKKIPEEIVDTWNLKADAINSICKLRNDISHANDYFESNDDILSKCAFVESLLIIALLQTIDVPISISAAMIFRLPGAQHLSSRGI